MPRAQSMGRQPGERDAYVHSRGVEAGEKGAEGARVPVPQEADSMVEAGQCLPGWTNGPAESMRDARS